MDYSARLDRLQLQSLERRRRLIDDLELTYRIMFGLIDLIISERELMFMFAICRRPSVCLSVVSLSVCRLQRSCTLLRLLKFSTMFLVFLRHLVPWPSMTFR